MFKVKDKTAYVRLVKEFKSDNRTIERTIYVDVDNIQFKIPVEEDEFNKRKDRTVITGHSKYGISGRDLTIINDVFEHVDEIVETVLKKYKEKR